MLRILLPLILLLGVVRPAFADYTVGAERLESEHELSMEFETPHTQWAKPYAQGTTRVLYICPYYQGSTEGREIIELMQRFDLEADIIYYQKGPNRLLGDGNTRWYVTDAVGTERALRLLETPYDVIFLNQVPLTGINETVRGALLKAVEGGAGLVYSGDEPIGEEKSWGAEVFTPEGPDWFGHRTHGVHPGPEADRSLAGVPYRRKYRYGAGRLVYLPVRREVVYRVGWDIEFDQQAAGVGRAILWAAKRVPTGKVSLGLIDFALSTDAAIAAKGYDTRHTEASLIKGEPRRSLHHNTSDPLLTSSSGSAWELQWSGMPEGSTGTVVLRGPSGYKKSIATVRMAETGTFPLSLPWLPTGVYYIDTRVRSERGVENWSTTSTYVSTNRSLKELTLSRSWAEVGERIEGSTQIASVHEGDKVVTRIFDGANRLLCEQPADVGIDGLVNIGVDVPAWFPMLVRVEAILVNGGYEFDATHAYLRITQRKQDQFNFILWNVPSGDLAPYGIDRMAQLGVTSILQGGPPPLALSASELTYTPYVTSFRASSHTVTAMLDDEGVLKTGCVHDEEAMAKHVAEVVARAQKAREHGTYVYSLGDENAVRGSCLSPQCLTAYRGYLADIYGTIGALNDSWDSSYTAFDDITLLSEEPLPVDDAPRWFKEYFAQRTLKNETDSEATGEEQIRMGDINDEIRALQNENYARWYDRQAFQSWSYVQWCKRFVKAFREIDPHSLTGFEGTDSFSIRRLTTRSRQGGDLDLFMRELEYFGPYRGPANEVTRSLAKPGFPAGNWIGYSRDPDVLLMNYWKQVLDDMCAVQWWRWDNMGEEYQPFLAPTLSPIGAAKEFIEDTRVVREGLGDLLQHYTMETNGIAMLYSMPSTHIAHFDGNRSYGKLSRDHDRWHEAIHNAGLQFDYVTDRQLRLGEFEAAKYKVLILAEAFALGEKEAAVIRDFVAQGGTVIADVRPGLYSDRCKPFETGILDDLFGVKRTGKQDAMAIDRMRIQGVLNEGDVYMEWGNWYGKDVYPQMHVDPTVELTTGEALGWAFPIHYHGGLKHPAGIVNAHGKGKAVLLNFSVYQAPFDALLRDLLAASGIRPTIQVRDTNNLPAEGPKFAGINDGEVEALTPTHQRDEAAQYPPGVEVTLWRDGNTELLALLGEHTGDVTVTLPEARQVYDLKANETIGLTETFTVSLKKSRARLYALLPTAVTEATLDFSVPQDPDGMTRKAAIAVSGMAGAGVVKLTLRQPEGSPAPWMPSRVITENGQGTITIPFAMNPAPGTWVLEATDLLSGATTTGEIQFLEVP